MKKNETEEQLIATQELDNFSASINATETQSAASQIPNDSGQNTNANDQKKASEVLDLQEIFESKFANKVKQEIQKLASQIAEEEIQKQRAQMVQELAKKKMQESQEDIKKETAAEIQKQKAQMIQELAKKKFQESQEDIEKETAAEIQKQVSEHTSIIFRSKIEEYDNDSEHSSIDLNDTQINKNKDFPTSPKKKSVASTNLIQDIEDHVTIDELAQEVLRDLEDDNIKITSVKQLRDLLKNPEKEEYKLEAETIQLLLGLSKEEKKDLFTKILDIENFEPEDVENPSVIDNFLSFFKEHLKKPLIQLIDEIDDATDKLLEVAGEKVEDVIIENIGTGVIGQQMINFKDDTIDALQNLYEPGDLDKIEENNEKQIIGGGPEEQQI
jgi:hypothetical protein